MPQTRKAVRILLINDKKELLLMCVENFDIKTLDGSKHKRLWCTVGGGIEKDESIQEAAVRELYEETGLSDTDINLGPIVWFSNVELILKGIPTQLEESFVVAHTKQTHVALHAPTQDEKETVTKFHWFTLEEIIKSNDPIFPLRLSEFLPDILSKKYPPTPFEI
jgi:8-oxo-dGTP pyrophosphatase MutT (NUDIX family)